MINLIDHYANGEKLYEKFVSKVMDEYHLTYMEFNIIMFLFNNPKYDTATSIVTYRHLSKSHVSTSVKTLIEKKLLTSEFYENDHKTIHLKLTEFSKPIAKKGLKVQNAFMDMLTEAFTKEEKDKLYEFIFRVDKNIDKYLK